MAPTLPSWKKECRVWRHGEAPQHEMLCQVAEKAPKWSFSGGKGHQVHEGLGKNTDFNVIPHDLPDKKFTKDPEFSFGMRRSASAPSATRRPGGTAGLDYRPRDQSTTPLYSFGSTKRPSPFPGQGGPGPQVQRSTLKGPKYSMGGSRGNYAKGGGPGPADYLLRDTSHSPSPTWGRGDNKTRKQRHASVGGPGPHYYRDTMFQDGPAYSMGSDERMPKRDVDTRHIGHNWTYFGYDDFGHTEHPDIIPGSKLPSIRSK